MNKYSGFGEWYIGRPGLKNTYEVINPEDDCLTDNKDIIVRIEEERHPFFLHFRLPEVIINPQGGIYFPKVSRDCVVLNERGKKGGLEYETRFSLLAMDRSHQSGRKGNVTQGGLSGFIDTFIPYRLYTAKDVGTEDAMWLTIITPILGVGQLMHIFYIEIPVYFVHDVTKTVTIPFAGIYYLNLNFLKLIKSRMSYDCDYRLKFKLKWISRNHSATGFFRYRFTFNYPL